MARRTAKGFACHQIAVVAPDELDGTKAERFPFSPGIKGVARRAVPGRPLGRAPRDASAKNCFGGC